MFRGGTTGTGVTSGLAPRQGYAHEPGHVVQDDWRKRKVGDIIFMLVEITVISTALYTVVLREAAKYQKRRIHATINRRFGNRFGST